MNPTLSKLLEKLFGQRLVNLRPRFVPAPDSPLHPDYQIERWKDSLIHHTSRLRQSLDNPTVSYIESMQVATGIRMLVCQYIDAWTNEIIPKQAPSEIRSLMEEGIKALEAVQSRGIITLPERTRHMKELVDCPKARVLMFDVLLDQELPRAEKARIVNAMQKEVDGTILALAA